MQSDIPIEVRLVQYMGKSFMPPPLQPRIKTLTQTGDRTTSISKKRTTGEVSAVINELRLPYTFRGVLRQNDTVCLF